MDLIKAYRYMGPSERKRAAVMGGLGVLAIALGILLVASRCSGEPRIVAEEVDDKTRAVLGQVRDAFFAVSAELAGESPARTVDEAVTRVATSKGVEFLNSKVDGSPIRFNPNLRQWSGGAPAVGGGGGADEALVVATAPASYKSRQITLVGVKRGGIPAEFAAGAEPAWLAHAVIGPIR